MLKYLYSYFQLPDFYVESVSKVKNSFSQIFEPVDNGEKMDRKS